MTVRVISKDQVLSILVKAFDGYEPTWDEFDSILNRLRTNCSELSKVVGISKSAFTRYKNSGKAERRTLLACFYVLLREFDDPGAIKKRIRSITSS